MLPQALQTNCRDRIPPFFRLATCGALSEARRPTGTGRDGDASQCNTGVSVAHNCGVILWAHPRIGVERGTRSRASAFTGSLFLVTMGLCLVARFMNGACVETLFDG